MQFPAPPPSPDWCLFLDVDGTLLDIRDTPFDTHADGDVKLLLRELSLRLGGAVALVSGRSIEFLDGLFAPLRLPCAGLHGVERRDAAGRMHGIVAADPRLAHVRTELGRWVAAHPGTLLEDKGRTVAVHYRLAPGFEAEVRNRVALLAASLGTGYHVQSGSMMLEIKPSGFDKGGAVAAFLEEQPFAGRTPVYAGDDLTDLDAFKVVEKRGGLAIAVGDRVSARYRLSDPRAVHAWLRRVAAVQDP